MLLLGEIFLEMILPKEMLVDYVRVYQNEGESDYMINENIYNYNN